MRPRQSCTANRVSVRLNKFIRSISFRPLLSDGESQQSGGDGPRLLEQQQRFKSIEITAGLRMKGRRTQRCTQANFSKIHVALWTDRDCQVNCWKTLLCSVTVMKFEGPLNEYAKACPD